MNNAQATRIVQIDGADVSLSDRNWPFAQSHAPAIGTHWRRRTRENPKLFNGEVLLLDSWSLTGATFRGTCLITDYASFLYWREHDTLDRSVTNLFAAAALHSLEGWLIVGRMGPHHSSAGLVHPPCGSLQPEDIRQGTVDLDGNIVREIEEETGLAILPAQMSAPILIFDGFRLAYMRPVRLPWPAGTIVDDIENHLAATPEPELAEILVVRNRADIDAAMPSFAVAYITHAFA